VVGAEVRGCLHLKSAVTALADDVLLVNREWIDTKNFAAFKLVDVAPEEPSAANVLRLRDRIVAARAFPRTADRIAGEGFQVNLVDASELAKAEGAVTCCSLIVPVRPFAPSPVEG
jgi:dimethylargininase